MKQQFFSSFNPSTTTRGTFLIEYIEGGGEGRQGRRPSWKRRVGTRRGVPISNNLLVFE